LLTEDLDVVLGLLLLLLLNYSLQVLLLLRHSNLCNRVGSLDSFVFLSSFLLFIFIICHVVKWFFIPFDVDFEAIKSILGARANTLLVKLNTLLLKEVLNCWFGDFTVIFYAVRCNSTLHVIHSIVSTLNLVFWKLSHAGNQFIILTIKNNHTTWENTVILHMLVETWLFSFFEFYFFILN